MTKAEQSFVLNYLRTEYASHKRSIENAQNNADLEPEKLKSIIGWNNARISEIMAIQLMIKAIPTIEATEADSDLPF